MENDCDPRTIFGLFGFTGAELNFAVISLTCSGPWLEHIHFDPHLITIVAFRHPVTDLLLACYERISM